MLEGIFVDIFSRLEDPRVERTQKHLFLEIIGLALFSTLAGAQSFTEMEDFCKHHIVWLKKYFLLPNGIPSHDTFYRVFTAINPEAFQASFLDWVKELIPLLPENVIPIDGKSICASRRDKFNFKERNLCRLRQSQRAMGYPKGRMQFFPLVAVARLCRAGEIKYRKQSRSLAAELLKALHIVSAFSCANGISLGQIIVDDKTNEITAIPELLLYL